MMDLLLYLLGKIISTQCLKVMLNLPLEHSSPPVILCKNDGFSKCKQLGQINHRSSSARF